MIHPGRGNTPEYVQWLEEWATAHELEAVNDWGDEAPEMKALCERIALSARARIAAIRPLLPQQVISFSATTGIKKKRQPSELATKGGA